MNYDGQLRLQAFSHLVVRWIFDALYESNIGCDFVNTEETELSGYDVLFIPALYSADEACLQRIKDYAAGGGTVIATFKTAFTDENVKVWPDVQPHLLGECFGVCYHEFTAPVDVFLTGDFSRLDKEERKAGIFVELLEPRGAQVVASCDHYMWKRYAAVTRNKCGKGECFYLGCMTFAEWLKALISSIWKEKGLWDWKQEYAFPLVITESINEQGKKLTWFLNYSKEAQVCKCPADGKELFSGEKAEAGTELRVKPWDLVVVCE